MPEPLKNRYSRRYIDTLADALADVQPGFDRAGFRRRVLGAGWPALELKQRMRRIAECLHAAVAGEYPQQIEVLKRAAPRFGGFEGMFFPDFVEVYGLDAFDASADALAHFTRFSSSEFAVRPFLVRYGDRMLAVMRGWADHADEHVRRLASEGCRPRLPWGIRLAQFVADPAPLLPILERLKDDPSDYVRRSVANNLNDIAKDHPEFVLDVARRWLGTSAATDRLVRHACRTMARRGDQRALALFGHHDAVDVEVSALTLTRRRLVIGEDLGLRFVVRAAAAAPLRIEYAIDFVKADGRLSRKVFKVGERRAEAGAAIACSRRHAFRDLTTRRHHPGTHRLAIIVNGVERAATTVRLRAARG